MRDRVLRFVETGPCPRCGGSGLRPEALAVTFAGKTIAELNAVPMTRARRDHPPHHRAHRRRDRHPPSAFRRSPASPPAKATRWRSPSPGDLLQRVTVLLDLGLGYLALGRATPTLSPGEMQRLRIATQLRSGLFGVIYVLDEPSAGLHPADAEPLLAVLDQLKSSGNSVFVVEHNMDVVRRADWLVDVGPRAGEGGGEVLYSGPVAGLAEVEASVTAAVPVPGRLHWGARRRSRRRRCPRLRAAAAAAGKQRAGWTCATSAGTTCVSSTRLPAGRPDRRHRRLRLGQVDAGQPGARRGGPEPRLHAGGRDAGGRCVDRTTDDDAGGLSGPLSVGPVSGLDQSTGWCGWTRSRSGAPRAPTSPPTRACSTPSARHSPPPTRPRPGASAPAGSPSTSPAAAARPARARASWPSNCCSCPAATARARNATARATTPRPSR